VGLVRIAGIALALALAVGWALADGRRGLRAWWTLRSDLGRASSRVAALESEIAALRLEAEALERGGFAVERAIREDLELARPGEVVVRLPPASGQVPEKPGESVPTPN
jgi:cell division protein FtsB